MKVQVPNKINGFSKWTKWGNRTSLKGLNYSGVYCLAISDKDLTNEDFDWIGEIRYVGMTNARTGLKGRLTQFDNTIKGKSGHGGADRFLFKHQNYQELIAKLFVSVSYFECDVKSNNPKDLLIMGEVAKFEYVCFAEYAKRFNRLPEFNDKPNSPKYSIMERKRK